MVELSKILAGLPQAWCQETADPPVKAGMHPASRQCTVSSLLIQRHCGGSIIRCEVGDKSWNRRIHYFNEIEGTWIDATADQFLLRSPRRLFQKNPPEGLYIFKDTWDRVDLLETRLRRVIEAGNE